MNLGTAIKRLEQLEKKVESLREDNLRLEEENKRLKKENKQLKGQLGLSWYSPRKKKTESTNGETPEERKVKGVAKANENRGAKKGHIGHGRKRKEADQHIHLKLKDCPDCKKTITGKQSAKYTRQMLELVMLPIIQTVEYHLYQAHCNHCQKTVVSQVDKYKPNQYIGPKLETFISLLRFKLNQSIDQTYQLINFLTTFDFNEKVISKGEIAETYLEVAEYGEEEYQKILRGIREGPYTHSDETGMSVAGENGNTWAYQNEDTVCYQVELSRGSKVVEGALGRYDGVVIADFYSGYRPDEFEIQRCWVHLLREVNKIKELNPNSDKVRYLHESLHRIYAECQEEEARTKGEGYFVEKVNHIIEKHRRYKKGLQKDVTRVISRLEKHINELFTFLRYPGIPMHNNEVERSIRTVARYRDGSYCLQSEKGMKAFGMGKSLVGTYKLRGENEFYSLLKVFSTKH